MKQIVIIFLNRQNLYNLIAKKAIKAIYREKQEVVIGGFLEILAVYVKRFFPVLLSRMVRKVKVT